MSSSPPGSASSIDKLPHEYPMDVKDPEAWSPAGNSTSMGKRSKNGVVLVPQPSDDPRDPLNWTDSRKLIILSVLSFAAFSGTVATLAGQLAYPTQAKIYGKSSHELSYSVSAAIAGLAGGPLVFAPFAQFFGKSSLMFWGLIGAIGCAIWSAQMTHQGDYISFICSRFLGGMFGALPTTLGADTIMDLYFLHERGKAFLTYSIALLLGTIAGPTFGGFIVGRASWTVCFWWTIAPLAVSAILIFIFVEETAYVRNGDPTANKPIPGSFLMKRVKTYFPGNAVTPRDSSRDFVRRAAAPILIGLSPATIIIGLFTMILFGWALLISILSPTFLQTPVKAGGYGFTSTQNAAFSFAEWVGLLTSQLVGYFTNDRLPLYICKKYHNGIWSPELRLHCIWMPTVVMCIGLGIFGAGLEYHLHYMVLALGVYLCAFAALLIVPICVNYVAENYTGYAAQAAVIMGVYRLSWGIAIPFFFAQWEEAVGAGWVLGMAAFFTIFAAFFVALVVWKGPTLRRFNLLKSLVHTEEGKKVL